MLEAAGTDKEKDLRKMRSQERTFLRREEVKHPPTGRAGERKESLDPCP